MKLRKLCLGCLITMGVMGATAMTSFAKVDEEALMRDAKEIQTVMVCADEDEVSAASIDRGILISSVEVGIQKINSKVARMSAEIFCHDPMKEIAMVLTLQKYNETKNMWQQVERVTFDWYAEDQPEGEDLIYATVEYDVPITESGMYRTRAIFSAEDMEDKYSESWSAMTSGLEF